MSNFTKTSTQIKNLDCLYKALKNMGFTVNQIEKSVEGGLKLKSYSGGTTGKSCQIRIKGAGWNGQNHQGGCVNDMGFELQADGTYTAHIDYHTGRRKAPWLKQLIQQYTKEVCLEIAEENNYFLDEEIAEDGEIKLRFSN